MLLRSTLFFVPAVLASSLACAQDYQLKDLRIADPYARATAPHQPAGGAYLTIENRGKAADRLVAAASPVAKSVEIHTMTMDGNVMKMREVSAIELPAGGKVAMMPGSGYHLMLRGLRQPLKAGDKFPLTLNFEKSGSAKVSVVVRGMNESHAGHASHADGQHHGH